MTVIVKNAGKFEGVHYAISQSLTVAADLEARMVNDGFATYGDHNQITVSRPSLAIDNGKDPLASTAASAITYTLFANLVEATRIRQDGAGAVTVQPDASVQMIGAGGSVITSLATTGVGSMILIEPIDLTVTPKKYLVIKGGA